MIEGGQYCKYSGFTCSYQGEKVMIELMGEKDVVTLCDLNNVRFLGLEDKLEDQEKQE